MSNHTFNTYKNLTYYLVPLIHNFN